MKIGLEAYYYSPQTINWWGYGRDYWFWCHDWEIMENFSIYSNFENFTDTRQTRFAASIQALYQPVLNILHHLMVS
jgi:iron complex outermembrane receptor protein